MRRQRMAIERPVVRVAGRPRNFDPAKVLDKAVRLFWRNGYEATSMSDLVAELGVGAPSLYAAFGNKADLFSAAVERYVCAINATLYSPIDDQTLTAREAVTAVLERAAHLFAEPETPAGCFMFSSVAAVSSSSASVENLLREKRATAEARLAHRLSVAVAAGELEKDADPSALAKYLMCVMEGMSMQARDDATEDSLRAVAYLALRAWQSNH